MMAGKLSFRGGIRFGKKKNAAEGMLQALLSPREIAVPLLQWQGSPDEAVVSVGEHVLRGQKIGEPTDEIGCPVFSGISGTVTAIEWLHAENGAMIPLVRIESDRKNTAAEKRPFDRALTDAAPGELIETIRSLGVIEMGTPVTPLHAKLKNAVGRSDTLIVNMTDDDPCLNAQHALMSEQMTQIVDGAKIMMAAAAIGHACIVIGEDARDLLPIADDVIGESDLFEIVTVRKKYPQGDDRLLLSALAQRELPALHTPEELGYTIVRAETCVALYEAMLTGAPQTERYLTVGGDAITAPGTLRVTLGTPVSALLSHCGGSADPGCTVIEGGAMNGCEVDPASADAVVTARTEGVLAFSEAHCRAAAAVTDPISAFWNRLTRTDPEPECIRCGRCVSVCPMQLMPHVLADAAQKGDLARCRAYHIETCIACGACSYVCPARVPVAQRIRMAAEPR